MGLRLQERGTPNHLDFCSNLGAFSSSTQNREVSCTRKISSPPLLTSDKKRFQLHDAKVAYR